MQFLSIRFIRLFRGELTAFVYCDMAGDVGRAIALGKKHGFFDRMVFVLGSHCYKAVDEIKKAKRPVVLGPELVHRERDSLTGKLIEILIMEGIAILMFVFAWQIGIKGKMVENSASTSPTSRQRSPSLRTVSSRASRYAGEL